MQNIKAERKKILLLGGAGFIGNAVLKGLLLEGDYEIWALEHHQSITISHPLLHTIPGRIGKVNFATLPFQPDIIIHAARNRTGKLGALGRSLMAWKGKLENQQLLQQCLGMKKPPCIFYFSGSLMYGHRSGEQVDEDAPLNPASFARQYFIAEQPFLNLQNKLPITMIRLPWVIGNGSWFRWKYLDYIQHRQVVPVYGSGTNKMSFMDVDAIAPAVIHLLKINFSGVLNLYYPHSFSQQEWAELLATCSGLKVEKLSIKEWKAVPSAVRESFTTEICLHSKYPALQKTLQAMQMPLEQTVKKHLSAMLQHK